MVANLFKVTCPYLYKVKAIAYFGLIKNHHSFHTINKIKDTTQLFVELYNNEGGTRYMHPPQKVAGRNSPTMFLPHKFEDDDTLTPLW